ncbi:hypothetical protein LRP49_10690 [Enterovibrio sp. ZSDZ35]|uniref:Uncharacterized protein n=1 Tax=Enterovibrio qingdaonensis TaxID=2899818 RepID=A0ABT5QL08_9GAMM|nr:hypothetical protein [Enterovibrio sp. ZSDZ35]MDD1781661.1 hypothetical protein [Enterovibrio sp. ZSDZ35]
MNKTLPALLAFTSILSLAPTVNAFELKPLTKEELKPFCQNSMIWGQFNVSEAQCLEVAVPCSKSTLKPGMNLGQATEALFSCTFSKLGIELPEFDDEDDF